MSDADFVIFFANQNPYNRKVFLETLNLVDKGLSAVKQ
jgi:hypothetical protein